jgi:hypothetical protein
MPGAADRDTDDVPVKPTVSPRRTRSGETMNVRQLAAEAIGTSSSSASAR